MGPGGGSGTQQVRTCGEKITLVDPEKKHTNGFVTNETEHNWIILTHTGVEILLYKGNYSSFIPVYIKVNQESTKMCILFSRIVIDKNIRRPILSLCS